MLNKGTASLEVKNSERNRELENSASLEPRVCEVLLYFSSTVSIVEIWCEMYFSFSYERSDFGTAQWCEMTNSSPVGGLTSEILK